MPFESRSLLRLRFVDQDRDRSAWRAGLIGVPNSGIQSTKNRLECPECFMMDFASPRRLQAYRKERHRREREDKTGMIQLKLFNLKALDSYRTRSCSSVNSAFTEVLATRVLPPVEGGTGWAMASDVERRCNFG